MKEVVYKQSQRRLIGILIAGIFMVSVSISFIYLYIKYEQAFDLLIIGIIGSVFFSLCLIFGVIRFIKPKDYLVINKDGFIDHSYGTSVGFVSWKYVRNIYINQFLTQTYISFDITDFDKVFENASKRIIRNAKTNSKWLSYWINIPMLFIKEKPKEVLDVLQKYLKAYHDNIDEEHMNQD